MDRLEPRRVKGLLPVRCPHPQTHFTIISMFHQLLDKRHCMGETPVGFQSGSSTIPLDNNFPLTRDTKSGRWLLRADPYGPQWVENGCTVRVIVGILFR